MARLQRIRLLRVSILEKIVGKVVLYKKHHNEIGGQDEDKSIGILLNNAHGILGDQCGTGVGIIC